MNSSVKIIPRNYSIHAIKFYRCKSSLAELRIVNDNIDKLNFMAYHENKEKHKFKNVTLITPNSFQKHFYTQFKLKFISSKNNDASIAGIELLRNVAANYDYWIVRNNQTHLLYYKADMMLQRLKFMKTVGLSPHEKLKQIQKYPPFLLFSFTDCSYNAKLVYLRGLIPKEEKGKFLHFFYPVTSEITLGKTGIEQRVKSIEDHLELQQPSVIRELVNMPCFFMEPSLLTSVEHIFLHKFSMPYKYSVDFFTAHILPPICNLPNIGLSAAKHFSNKADMRVLSELPSFSIGQLLDYRYLHGNGSGQPECLSSFLTKAELEEKKDRTGGQQVKGIRGFNVPLRQY